MSEVTLWNYLFHLTDSLKPRDIQYIVLEDWENKQIIMFWIPKECESVYQLHVKFRYNTVLSALYKPNTSEYDAAWTFCPVVLMCAMCWMLVDAPPLIQWWELFYLVSCCCLWQRGQRSQFRVGHRVAPLELAVSRSRSHEVTRWGPASPGQSRSYRLVQQDGLI